MVKEPISNVWVVRENLLNFLVRHVVVVSNNASLFREGLTNTFNYSCDLLLAVPNWKS